MGDKFNAGFVEMQTGQDIRKVFESMINKKKLHNVDFSENINY